MAFNNVGSLTVSLLGNTMSASKGLDKMNAKVAAFGAKVAAVGVKVGAAGKAMTLGITLPLVAIGTLSVIAFDKQAKALAQVESGIKSTGGACGYTVKELAKIASGLQEISIYGDEDILRNVTAQLITFANIVGPQFEGAQVAVMNLAARLGTDLKSAAIQVGKALNDPITGLSMLSRSGITFSETQKELINSLWETGKHAEAQTVILKELEKQYGGSAAAAVVGTGKLKQFKNMLGDVSESFGEVIVMGLDPIIAKMKDWLQSWKDLTIEERARIIKVALVIGALGPLLVILGKILVIMPKLAAALTLLMNHPIVAAIGLISIAFITLYHTVDSFRYFWDDVWVAIVNTGKTAANAVISVINGISGAINLLIKGINLIPGINIPDIEKIAHLDLTSAITQFDEIRAAIQRVNEAVGDVPTEAAIAEWKKLTDAIVEKYGDMYPELKAIQEKALADLESGVETSISHVNDKVRQAIEASGTAAEAIATNASANVENTFATMSWELHFLTLKMEAELEAAGKSVKTIVGDMTPALKALYDEFGDLADKIAANAKGTIEYGTAMEELKKLFDKVNKAVEAAGNDATENLLNLQKAIKEKLGATAPTLRENVAAWVSWATAVGNATDIVKRRMDDLVSGISNTLSTFFDAVVSMKETNEKALEDYNTALQGFADAEGKSDKAAAERRRIALRELSDDLEDDKITREKYGREKAQIEADYSKAVDDAATTRKNAGIAEKKAYKEQQVGIKDILGDMLHDLLHALREQLQLEAAKEAVIAAAMLFTLNIPGSIAHGLAAATYLMGATGLALAGYEQGGTVPGPPGEPIIIEAHGGETITPVGGVPAGIDYQMIGRAVAAGTYDAMKEVMGKDSGRPIIVQVGEAQLARVMYPALLREGQRLGVTA